MFDVRDLKHLQDSLARYDFLINRPLLQELNHFPLACPLASSAPVNLIVIKSMPASQTVSTFQFILNALNSLGETIGYLLDFNTSSHSIYIGIKGNSSFALSLLQEGLTASFPGITIEEVNNPAAFLQALFCPALYSQLAAVTVIPNASISTSLLTDFTSLMAGTDFTAFFLAQPVPRNDILCYYNELCELYYSLSLFSQTSMNHSKGLAKNSSTTIVEGETITQGNSHSITNGSSNSTGDANYKNSTISSSGPVPALNDQNVNLSYLVNTACNHSQSMSESTVHGNTYSEANLHNTSRLSAENRTDNTGMGYSIQNIYVQNTLGILANVINRVHVLSQIFCFQYGAYFFSSSPAAAARAAYSFAGLAPNLNTYLGPSVVNLFDGSYGNYNELFASLLQFEHPRFCTPNSCEVLTSTTLIQSSELLNSIYLPTS